MSNPGSVRVKPIPFVILTVLLLQFTGCTGGDPTASQGVPSAFDGTWVRASGSVAWKIEGGSVVFFNPLTRSDTGQTFTAAGSGRSIRDGDGALVELRVDGPGKATFLFIGNGFTSSTFVSSTLILTENGDLESTDRFTGDVTVLTNEATDGGTGSSGGGNGEMNPGPGEDDECPQVTTDDVTGEQYIGRGFRLVVPSLVNDGIGTFGSFGEHCFSGQVTFNGIPYHDVSVLFVVLDEECREDLEFPFRSNIGTTTGQRDDVGGFYEDVLPQGKKVEVRVSVTTLSCGSFSITPRTFTVPSFQRTPQATGCTTMNFDLATDSVGTSVSTSTSETDCGTGPNPPVMSACAELRLVDSNRQFFESCERIENGCNGSAPGDLVFQTFTADGEPFNPRCASSLEECLADINSSDRNVAFGGTCCLCDNPFAPFGGE